MQRCRKCAAEDEQPLHQIFDDARHSYRDVAGHVAFAKVENSMYKWRRTAMPTLDDKCARKWRSSIRKPICSNWLVYCSWFSFLMPITHFLFASPYAKNDSTVRRSAAKGTKAAATIPTRHKLSLTLRTHLTHRTHKKCVRQSHGCI